MDFITRVTWTGGPCSSVVDTTRLEALRLATTNPHWTPAECVEAAKVYFAFLTGAQPVSGGG